LRLLSGGTSDPTLTTVFFDAIYLPEPSAGLASAVVVLTLLGLRRRLARSLRPG
jgi:hypothetical protein